MAELISAPSRIPVPGGKLIEEYVGRVNSATSQVSIAHMVAPAGWTEPAQTPQFDEFTLVLRGTVVVDVLGDQAMRHQVHAGQAIVTRAGEKVRYSTADQETEYIAVCRPAFAPELANRDEEEPA